MSYFCDKYGKECPNGTPRAQSYNCVAWDPRDFLADKTCRHALTVDNMDLAIQQWLAANKNITGRKKRIETPERKPVIMNKDGEIDAKQTAILQRTELMRRQTAAQEKLAAEVERIKDAIADIADHFGLQMAAIIDTLDPIARAFRDDEEAAEPCDNDCEHCDWATCPKEEAKDEP